MRSRLLVVVLLAGLASPTLKAQSELKSEVLALGHGLHLALPTAGGLYVQGTDRISFMDLRAAPKVSAEAELAADAFVWTIIEEGQSRRLEMQTALGTARSDFHAPGEKATISRSADPMSIFRGPSSAPPEYRDYLRVIDQKRHEVRPRLDGLEVVTGDGEETLELPAQVASEQSLGYGLGYEMSARVVAPYFALDGGEGPGGAAGILYRDGGHFRYRSLGADRASAKSIAWGRAPASESTEVVRFDQRVPPLAADYDGDGQRDLIHLDTGGGYVFVYRGSERLKGEDREPDQIFKVGGHALWRYLVDVNGDGRLDLLVLTMNRMNVIAQVNIMRERSLPVRLFCRLQKEDGSFEASATWSLGLQLPCEIALTRNIRRVRFRSPLLVLGHLEGRARILATREGAPVLLEMQGNDWATIANAGELLLENGHWAEPFSAPVRDFDGDGRDEVILLARDLDGELDRLLRLRLP